MSLLLPAVGLLAFGALVVTAFGSIAWLWVDTDRIADELLAEAARRDREVAR